MKPLHDYVAFSRYHYQHTLQSIEAQQVIKCFLNGQFNNAKASFPLNLLGVIVELYQIMTSSSSGYIANIESESYRKAYLDDRERIRVPAGTVTMVSFPKFDHFGSLCPGLRLYTHSPNGSRTMLWRECDHFFLSAYVFEVQNITVQKPNATNFPCRNSTCFRMLFSFHADSRPPQKLPSGLFNCTGDTYRSFQKHLECNTKVECEDGRDERERCSRHHCHRMMVVSRNKYFMSIGWDTIRNVAGVGKTIHTKVAEYCQSLNGSIGMPSNDHDIHSALTALTKSCWGESFIVGLYMSDIDAPDIYRDNVVAGDRTVIHHSLTMAGFGRRIKRIQLRHFRHTGVKRCLMLAKMILSAAECNSYAAVTRRSNGICQFTAGKDGSLLTDLPHISFPSSTQKQQLMRCSNNEVTHAFLFCFPHNVCGQQHVTACPGTIKLTNSDDATWVFPFTCGDGTTQLSYTLLCDFRQDCPDNSDESFCRHPPCDAFACSSGQCISYNKRCDRVKDCTDVSDEQECAEYRSITILSTVEVPSPAIITFGKSTVRSVSAMSSGELCPDTHYRCPGEFNDCLPIYTRCNGWYDCIGREDEEACDNMTCPGYYRCFQSVVCVHADHLCDDQHHCPQQDDEWLCNMTCPSQCLCLGQAFVCPHHFSVHLHPQIRYLDAQDSRLTPEELGNNLYLVFLSLANCSVKNLQVMNLPNIQSLDLSGNFLKSVEINILAGLSNLQTISLARNPLGQIYCNKDSSLQQTMLRIIDLSHTNLKVFSSKIFSSFPYLQKLNLSHNEIHTLLSDGFHFTPLLTHLYMEGNPMKTFPEDLYEDLLHIRFISAQTYKLCCKILLPDASKDAVCVAERDEFSSCEDLLQNETYRAFLWIIGFLSVVGNVFCFTVRACVQRKVSKSGFSLFVTNLSMADLLMGIYSTIIGSADEVFRGKYVYHDSIWTGSAACKVAGFLSLLSSEVSALTICLITVDRFIVLRFPFSSFRFGRRSASAMCIIAWLLGLSIAVLPLLPMMSHWEFYSQTGICIPLPITKRDFKGRAYSFGILIVLNFILFLLIASGQAFIYWSVQNNALTSETTKVSRDMTIAQRLISVAVTDFLCWFPIGVCGLLASFGTLITSEVNVALAIFVLPLNSALNPFVYTFNMLLEKRRKSNEAKLLKWLESHTELIAE